jgi:integrase
MASQVSHTPVRPVRRKVSVRSGSHLKQIGQTWYYRRAVPKDAHHIFGKTEVVISLETTNRVEAELLEKQNDLDFARRLQKSRDTGPDGWPLDPEKRLAQMVDDVLYRHVKQGVPLDLALAGLPEGDRVIVGEEIDKMADLYDLRKAKVQAIVTELDEMILSSGQDWDRVKPGLFTVVKSYLDSLQTEHTIEWAFNRWTRAKDRPQQTVDEARRHLTDFTTCAHVRALAEVRRSHVLKWRDALQDADKLAPKSINQRLQLVSAILRQGWRDAEMPSVDLQRINVPVPVDSPRSAWEKEKLLQALNALADQPLWARWVYVIALTAGPRIGEALAAKKDWHDPLGFIDVPKSATKMNKYHVIPLIELIREPLARYVATRPDGAYLFDAPRPGNTKLKVSHEVSKWFSRFWKQRGISNVVHELRHTWKEAARASPIKKEIHDIITGHAPGTIADKYGGAKPAELLKANEIVCQQFIDEEIAAAIKRLVV